MGQEKKLEVAGISIKVHPHPAGKYVELLRKAFRLKRAIRSRGDQHLIIRSLKTEDDGVSGELARFTKVDLDQPWLNFETLEKANDDEIEEIKWPTGLYPNLSTFRYRFYAKEHVLIFETYADSAHVSPRSICRFFDKLFETKVLAKEADSILVDLVVDQEAVDRLLEFPSNYQDLFDGSDRNQRLYRILPLERLIQIFENREITLLSPTMWEDPFEALWLRLIYGAEQIESRCRVFGLCLSVEARSDALWRIYSPGKLGIRIRTTRERLKRNLENANEIASANTFIKCVTYLDDIALAGKAAALKRSGGSMFAPLSPLIADAWMYKRRAYRHEREARLMCVFPNRAHESQVLKISIDPHDFIESIHMDPRAPDDVVATLRSHLARSLNFDASRIRRSALYTLPRKIKKMMGV